MKQFQLVLLFALVAAAIMLVKANDDKLCRSYGRKTAITEDFLARCGPFELVNYDPMGCVEVCNLHRKNAAFEYEVNKGCCCATMRRQAD